MTTGFMLSSENLGLKPDTRGKVRDLFDLGDRLLIVATDRISAYDHVMPEGVEGKGEILTRISVEWFHRMEGHVAHHLISPDWRDFPDPFRRPELAGRSMLVHKAERFDLECVVRGYLAGSGLKDYRAGGEICGIRLPPGLREAEKLEEPLFTPASKSDEGHDLNVTLEQAGRIVGGRWLEALARASRSLYERGEAYARSRGFLIADTKFEFGLKDGKLMLIDELLTPDSSRYWAIEDWAAGKAPESYDKQILRDWLDERGWDRQSPPPHLPESLRADLAARYEAIFDRLFPSEGEAR